MAFTNLFSGLSAMGEGARSASGSYATSSNRLESDPRGKRKTQGEQRGSSNKRRNQFQTKDGFTSGSKPCRKQGAGNMHSSMGQKSNSRYDSRQSGRGQNHRAADNRNVRKELHQSSKKKKNYQQQERPVFMTQEFKDQNGLLVDGRLLCRHYLFGKCIKEENCQLEHVQGYNGILKKACKFYVQGFCMKGERCPYMHRSFPCKFFHTKGKCLQEGNCRFSHEPLNDVTEKLLEEVLKQEECLLELAEKNKEESSEQQASAEETKPAEENQNPDFLTQPLRPRFYNSTDPEKEAHENPDVLDGDQPQSSSLNTQNHPEPVCYSVEALLGPQLPRTFSSFSKAPVGQDSPSVPDPRPASDVAYTNQSHVPYSVEAVLSSYRSADISSSGQTSDPPSERTVFYAPLVISEGIKAPPFRKEKPPPNLSLVEKGSQEPVPKSFSSREVKNGLFSDSAAVLCHPSEEESEGRKTCTKQESAYLPEKSASSRSREAKHSLPGIKRRQVSVGYAGPPKHPAQLKPNVSEGRVAVPVEAGTTWDKRGDQVPEVLPNGKKKHLNVQAATLEHLSSIGSQKPCRETASLGHLPAGLDKTQKRLFSCLFAAPLTDSVTAGSDSFTAAMKPQGSEDVPAPSFSFSRLFASPLINDPPRSETRAAGAAAAPPCKRQPAENAASNSKPRDSDRRLFPSQVRASHCRRTSCEPPLGSSTEKDARKQPSASAGSTVSGSPRDPSSSRTNRRPPDVSSPRDASAPSVLKSLFVQLGPYREDAEQPGPGQSTAQSEDERERGVSLKS
ncbi:uncharacterized protein LOC105940176 isoform X3 [Fundulus heteroclitus]|uniref:uncharacterized protein LOC105940176 isoform X3 n=1 Tax=Fundulus heteroclitus TaxID=8078 RepID=UPI00165AC821|nr:uncharacterized protein LOC105940176 isoform X3 [Fundulus heteroclitus]